MKALGLRVDIGFAAAVVLLVSAIFLPATVNADEAALKDALHDYATGDYSNALTKLRAYVESNPEDSEVYAVLGETENRVLLRALAEGGEHERLIKYLLNKAKPLESGTMTDEAEIKAKVDEAVTSSRIETQRQARADLVAAGERAVPALVGHLGSESAEHAVNAILALRQLGHDAVVPLSEALASDNASVRGRAAAVLGDLGDTRALAALLNAAENDDDPGVKEKAAGAAAKLGGSGSAADAYAALSYRYYSQDPSVVAAFDSNKSMWRWEDGALARYDVPAYLYPYQMAEECASDALALDAGNRRARAMLVRSLLAQKVEADVLTANGGSAPESLAGAFDLAESQGFAAASAALGGSLKGQDWDVAVECCYLVAATYGGEDLGNHPLGHALAAPQKRVRYAAAISALLMSPKAGMPNADKVVSLGAQAASEAAIRQALVIDDNDETRSKLVMALHHGGVQAAGSSEGTDGAMRAKRAPSLDVIVVRADLGDQTNTIPSARHSSSYMVIDELVADARTQGMKIVVLVQDTSELKADAVQAGFTEKYGDKVHGYISCPIVESAAVSAVNAALADKELNVDQERANALAASAADAFAKVDFSCKSFDLTVAIEPLSAAATSGPTPAVRMNATKALGNLRVGGGDALVSVLNEGEGDELKAAAATSLGAVLSANDGTAEQIDALIAASSSGGAVGKAALAALGQVRNLSAEQRLAIFSAHRLQVSNKGD
jgi:HEAT repeat protein